MAREINGLDAVRRVSGHPSVTRNEKVVSSILTGGSTGSVRSSAKAADAGGMGQL